MSDFYKKVCAIVRQRNGIVGPLQLWQVVNDEIVRWHSTLGSQPTPEEVNQIELETNDRLLSAEEIVSQYFSPYHISALQRFELALIKSAKPLGEKMSALKTWLEYILLTWSQDPTPKPASYFGEPPCSFEDAAAEAAAALTSDQ